MTILLILYCFLFLICSGYLGLKFRDKTWTIENFFLLIIVIAYIFVPINIIVLGGEIYETGIKSYMIPASRFVSFSSFIITFLFLLIFIIGENVRGSSAKLVKIYIRQVYGRNLSKVAAYFLSGFCLVSLIIYIEQFGGFSSFAINQVLNKSNMLAPERVGSYAFFGRFIDIAIIPIIYFLYEKRKTKVEFIFLLFLPLAILVFNNLFIAAAKLNFIGLVLLFYFTVSIKQKKLYLHYAFLIFTFIFIGLPILDDVFIIAYKTLTDEGILAVPFRITSAILSGSLGKGEYEVFLKESSDNLYLKSIEYFTYIQMSLQLSIDTPYPLIFFRDLLTGITNLMPSRLNIQLGFGIQQLNTAIYYNLYPNIPELTYGIPPGIIGFGMYSLSVPGVFIIAFILGYIFRGLDIFFKSIVEIDKNFSSFYAYMLVILSVYPINGDPKEAIYNIGFLVFLFMFFLVNFKFETLKTEDARS